MKILSFITLLLVSCAAQAVLYKTVDENGEVVYTDKPPSEDAVPYQPPELMVTPPVKYQPKPDAAEDKQKKQEPAYTYTRLVFIKPEADANIFDNEGNIPYQIEVTPVVNHLLGHHLIFKLDGRDVSGKTLTLASTLSNVDRGSHTLVAEVRNRTGKVLISSSVTFHLHKATVKRAKTGP